MLSITLAEDYVRTVQLGTVVLELVVVAKDSSGAGALWYPFLSLCPCADVDCDPPHRTDGEKCDGEEAELNVWNIITIKIEIWLKTFTN